MEPEQLHPCQCCGELTISEPEGWEICPVCNWEDDQVQANNPDYRGGANDMSLVEAREFWRRYHKPLPPNKPHQ